jgi:hypothetical protein
LLERFDFPDSSWARDVESFVSGTEFISRAITILRNAQGRAQGILKMTCASKLRAFPGTGCRGFQENGECHYGEKSTVDREAFVKPLRDLS